jgi:hypothetical protein
MKPAAAPVDRVLRAWPQLRGYFRGRNQIPEAELLAFFQLSVPEVTAGVWPAVRQGLLRSELLHEVAPGLLSFELTSPAGPFPPAVAPEWRALWQQLQAGLALPLGCLWSTRWLRPLLPDVPELLVVEVSWAEQRWAAHLLEQSPAWAVVGPESPLLAGGERMAVLVRSWQAKAPVRRVEGIPVARLEKMLVDASLLPALAGRVPEAHLRQAVRTLLAGSWLNPARLLRYAESRGAGARWSALASDLAGPQR